MVRRNQKFFSSLVSTIPPRVNTKVYFDIDIGDEEEGRIEFELFDEIVPKTAMNFRKLCTEECTKFILKIF